MTGTRLANTAHQTDALNVLLGDRVSSRLLGNDRSVRSSLS